MSKNVAVFVDVANLYYAARGQDVDVDYVALLKHATKGRDLIRAYAYSGLDPENENQKKFLDFLNKNGYRVVAKDIRKFGDGRVKANLDIELVVDLFRLADRMDVAVIVSGDGDFAPAIRALQDHGVRCEVISFKPNTSSDLFAVADEFVDVMKISAIGRQKDAKGVSAPEMPAKEVNPDVGFREASPSVAAAALAAIRSDGDDAGRGRGRGTSRRKDITRGGRSRSRSTDEQPAAATAAAATPPVAPADEDAGSADGRRRRRRGGRGRGRRGRRGDSLEPTEVTTGTEPADIGWEELDSLEELDGGAASPVDADLSFEEADAETLAELGMSEAPAPDAEESAPTDAKPKAKARTRSTAKSTTAKSTTGRAKTTRTTTAKTTAKASSRSRTAKADGEAAAAKPASRSRSTKAKPAAAPATEGGDAADQGIWQRFTSGRGRKRTAPEPPAEG
jgi:uncharacterized LabA/DUF88 family protein